jgi:hypothetical protein
LISLPAGVIAPIYVGWVYDVTGSYIDVYTLVLPMLVIAAIALYFADPPEPVDVVSDIKKFL